MAHSVNGANGGDGPVVRTGRDGRLHLNGSESGAGSDNVSEVGSASPRPLSAAPSVASKSPEITAASATVAASVTSADRLGDIPRASGPPKATETTAVNMSEFMKKQLGPLLNTRAELKSIEPDNRTPENNQQLGFIHETLTQIHDSNKKVKINGDDYTLEEAYDGMRSGDAELQAKLATALSTQGEHGFIKSDLKTVKQFKVIQEIAKENLKKLKEIENPTPADHASIAALEEEIEKLDKLIKKYEDLEANPPEKPTGSADATNAELEAKQAEHQKKLAELQMQMRNSCMKMMIESAKAAERLAGEGHGAIGAGIRG